MDQLNVAANATFADPETLIPGVGDNILVAYVAILVMALVPIWIGSFQSLSLSETKEGEQSQREVMSHHDAMMFPVYASGSLLSLYLIFKYLGKEYLNQLVTVYFFILGAFSVAQAISPLVHQIVPSSLHGPTYRLKLTEKAKAKSEDKEPTESEHFDVKFDYVDIGCGVIGAAFGVWYIVTKHWIANNIFGLSFSISGISMLSVNTFPIGAMLLGGLFLYDIFWVFGTEVMVTVAKSFDAPIKVLFPRDFLVNGIHSTNHAMLGLGDIVLPGIMIALLLRFDRSRHPQGHAYFTATYIAYIVGLVTTIAVMHVFKAAQPALLYLSPACTFVPMLVAVVRGETKLLFAYRDEPEEETDKPKSE